MNAVAVFEVEARDANSSTLLSRREDFRLMFSATGRATDLVLCEIAGAQVMLSVERRLSFDWCEFDL